MKSLCAYTEKEDSLITGTAWGKCRKHSAKKVPPADSKSRHLLCITSGFQALLTYSLPFVVFDFFNNN